MSTIAIPYHVLISFLKFWFRARKGFSDEILDHSFITKLVFYPRKENLPRDENLRHLKFVMHDGVHLSGMYIERDPAYPSLLLFHGNGEIINDYLYFSKIYTESYNLAVVDFRGYGESDGKPYFTSLFSDAPLVYEQFRGFLATEGKNTDIIVLGRSLGSVCASVIGSKNPEGLKAIVFESGFANLYKLWMSGVSIPGVKISDQELALWSNDRYISQIKVPVLIIHGTRDEVIPFAQAKLIEKSLNSKYWFVPINGAGHNDIMMYSREYRDALKQLSP